MRLIIVRHGETDRNVDRHLPGDNRSTPMNANGQRQTEAVARRLADEKIHIIYSSDLPRAKATTEAIAIYHPDVPIVFSTELRERNSGEYFNRTVAEREAAQQASGQSFRDWQPKGGESLNDVKRRAGRWLKLHRKKDADCTVLVVSHGLFIFTLLEWAVEEGAEVEKEKYSHLNTGVTILDVPLEGPSMVINLNDTSHLN